ncbi:hypothetical protein OEB94_14550 [Streptomyces sp. ICN988]|nr:hypothetical protein [Streptomyces sp. ICN988]MCV2460497.1 hypothetical protein [Streptomyces sp. ICN988]
MSPALRKRPFHLACAAATSASAPQRPETDRNTQAPAVRRTHLLLRSGR